MQPNLDGVSASCIRWFASSRAQSGVGFINFAEQDYQQIIDLAAQGNFKPDWQHSESLHECPVGHADRKIFVSLGVIFRKVMVWTNQLLIPGVRVW